MQRMLHGSKLISHEANLCIVVVVIQDLTSSPTSEYTIARSDTETNYDNYLGKTKLKKAKYQLLRSKQQISQPDQLEAIDTCICTQAGDDVHTPIHTEEGLWHAAM